MRKVLPRIICTNQILDTSTKEPHPTPAIEALQEIEERVFEEIKDNPNAQMGFAAVLLLTQTLINLSSSHVKQINPVEKLINHLRSISEDTDIFMGMAIACATLGRFEILTIDPLVMRTWDTNLLINGFFRIAIGRNGYDDFNERNRCLAIINMLSFIFDRDNKLTTQILWGSETMSDSLTIPSLPVPTTGLPPKPGTGELVADVPYGSKLIQAIREQLIQNCESHCQARGPSFQKEVNRVVAALRWAEAFLSDNNIGVDKRSARVSMGVLDLSIFQNSSEAPANINYPLRFNQLDPVTREQYQTSMQQTRTALEAELRAHLDEDTYFRIIESYRIPELQPAFPEKGSPTPPSEEAP